MNFIRCLNLVSNNTKLNQINEDKIETNKKQDINATIKMHTFGNLKMYKSDSSVIMMLR